MRSRVAISSTRREPAWSLNLPQRHLSAGARSAERLVKETGSLSGLGSPASPRARLSSVACAVLWSYEYRLEQKLAEHQSRR
jgi:hypothetical protein